MLTFKEFVAVRRECADLQTEFNDLCFEQGESGWVYPDGLFIPLSATNGTGWLPLIQDEYTGPLEYLEAILYCFYLEVADQREWPDENIGALFDLIRDNGTREQFASALLANRDAGDVCHHQDYCDVNQLALDVLYPDEEYPEDAIDRAADLYESAGRFLSA